MNTLYEILGVKCNTTTVEIKQAYYKKAQIHHPDKGGNAEIFQQIHEAYKILSDDKKRAAYDRDGTILKDDANDFAWVISTFTQMSKVWLKAKIEGKEKQTFTEYARQVLSQNRRQAKKLLKETIEKKNKIQEYKEFSEREGEGMNIFSMVVQRMENELKDSIADVRETLSRTELLEEEFDKYTFHEEHISDDDEIESDTFESLEDVFKKVFKQTI